MQNRLTTKLTHGTIKTMNPIKPESANDNGGSRCVQPVVRSTSGKCLFCGSRKCSTRVYTRNLGYDEVACDKHIKELHTHADETLGSPGVIRMHLSSTGSLKRGEYHERDWEIAAPNGPSSPAALKKKD